MAALIDRVGKRYGCLTVLEQRGLNKHKQTLWLCRCDCGNEMIQAQGNLKKDRKNCVKCQGENKARHYTKDSKAKHLYFIRCGDYVKIGVTSNVKRRLQVLQASTPYKLTLIRTEENREGLEEFYHSLYRTRHHRGEWYRFAMEEQP